MSNHFDGWPHVVQAQQFSRRWIEEEFLPLTDEMQGIFRDNGCNILNGMRMISFFYEPSTRTRMSFEMAMSYLGGVVAFSTENAREFSSAKKGETLADTIRVINRYCPHVIVIRYHDDLGAKLAAEVSKAPIINAGDREPGQHPTQALLDLRTIFKHRGRIDGLKIAMVGDLKEGRTTRSLSYLLGKFKGVEISFISPDNLRMADDVKEYLQRHNVFFNESRDLIEVIARQDVVYETRVQKERGSEIDRSKPQTEWFDMNAEVIKFLKKDAILMHPLPRGVEISPDVDTDPRSVYLTDQIDSGLVTRMALLKMILAPNA